MRGHIKQDRFTTCGTGSLFWRVETFAQIEHFIKNFGEKTTGKFYDCFLGKTRLAKNFQKVYGGGKGGCQPCYKICVPQVKISHNLQKKFRNYTSRVVGFE